MISVRLFCDWQDSATLTENVLKDFRETLQISNDNVYKDVRFVSEGLHDIGIHINNYSNSRPLGCKSDVVISFEPPELLGNCYSEWVDNYAIPDPQVQSDYHPTLWTLHADIEHDVISPSDKHHKMSWIMSNKGITETHRKRLELAHQIFHNKIGRGIKFFGTAFGQRLKNKSDGLSDFGYSIAFENSLEMGVLTEKFYDCIVNNCIPITNNKTAFDLFDKDAFIYIGFDDSVDDIIDTLFNLMITPISHEQNRALLKAKQEILYGKRNPVHEIYEIVHKVIGFD